MSVFLSARSFMSEKQGQLLSFPIPELTSWEQLGIEDGPLFDRELSPFVQEVELLLGCVNWDMKSLWTREDAARFLKDAFKRWGILDARLKRVMNGLIRADQELGDDQDYEQSTLPDWMELWWPAFRSWADLSLKADIPQLTLEDFPSKELQAWQLPHQLQIEIWGQVFEVPEDADPSQCFGYYDDIPF